MGNYITIADLVPANLPLARALQLVDDGRVGLDTNGALRTEHNAIINDAIRGAESDAESYACARYSSAALRAAKPEAFVQKVIDLALVKLAERRPPLSDDMVRKADSAIAWLRDLAKRVVSLGIDEMVAEKTEAQGGAEAVNSGPDPMMDSTSLEGL